MTLSIALFAASIAILPSDRMALADRLFDRGRYAEARREYLALKGEKGVPEEDILYRIAEATRADGDRNAARAAYGEFVSKFPASRHADKARLQRALAGTDADRRAELPALDAEGVPGETRSAALYHLGVLERDPEMLLRASKVDPKGRYAVPARFHRASLLAESKDPHVRRNAVAEFNELSFLKDTALAESALYFAVRCSFTDGRYAEAASLAQRYLKQHPDGAHAGEARIMAAWALYEIGKWSLALSFCGEEKSDAFDFLRAACTLASGDNAKAKALFEKYLQDHPDGLYRKNAELPLARIDFGEAAAGSDKSLMVEAARRSAKLSGSSGDRLRLAWSLQNAQRDDEAREEYSAIARDFPKSADGAEALYLRALMDVRAKKWSEAELALAEALSGPLRDEHRATALFWRGESARRIEHFEEGARFMKEALAAGLPLDEAREARLFLADEDFKAGRVAEAREKYAALVREGACVRMNGARIRNVGRFLLSDRGGASMPEEAIICAEALIGEGDDAAAWRQSGWALKGAAEEKRGSFAAAMEAYRRAMSEKLKAPTEDLPAAAYALGLLETKAGEYDRADATLRETVALCEKDNKTRMLAYLALAENDLAWGRAEDARKYATIVTALFDDKAAAERARAIILRASEAGR